MTARALATGFRVRLRDDVVHTDGGCRFGVRVDSHAHSGYSVPPHYDSMIAKIIVHRQTREEAIATMQRALSELRISGIKTTSSFHKTVLAQPEFVQGTVDTKWVERVLLPRLQNK